MERRTFLAATCGSMAGFAGCSHGGTEQGTPTTTPAPISAYSCPPNESYSGSAVCSHTVETAAASVYLLPSQTMVDSSTATVELTLHNEPSTELAFNPHQWSIPRQTHSGWVSVEQRTSGDGVLTLPPGETPYLDVWRRRGRYQRTGVHRSRNVHGIYRRPEPRWPGLASGSRPRPPRLTLGSESSESARHRCPTTETASQLSIFPKRFE